MKFTSTEATPAPHVPPGVLRLTGAAKEDIPMYRIQTMNKISPVGLNRFPSELYEVGDAVQDPQGILVRSAKLLDLEFNPGLLAIARAGVGVNNIPLDRCAAAGIPVFSTPGANANAVKELVICAMLMAFLINAKVASIYLVAVVFLGVIMIFIMRKVSKYFSEVFKKYDDLNASVQENVAAQRVVKAYVREDYEIDKFHKASYNIYKMFKKAECTMVTIWPVMQFTVYGCILGISWLGAHMIVASQLTTGELMSLLTYCMTILMNLMMLAMIFVMMTMSAASGKRIAEVLNEKADITNPEQPDYDVTDGSIRFDHVTFRYNKQSEKPVLDDLNFEIKAGETIGILGGTGSSKTSLVNLISRLYDVTEGTVYVGGKDVRNYDLETLRNEVSVVLQKNVLFSGTILENLRWGDENATEEECIRACRLACADEFIEKMPGKYNTYIEQGGSNVSGGQKQRLCIARALLKKPKVLILDDSTSAVDTATDAKIRKAFATEIPGTTKIIIAQRISSIQDADRIIVMDNGRIDAFASHEELLRTNNIYKEVYEAQTQTGGGDFDENGGES